MASSIGSEAFDQEIITITCGRVGNALRRILIWKEVHGHVREPNDKDEIDKSQ